MMYELTNLYDFEINDLRFYDFFIGQIDIKRAPPS